MPRRRGLLITLAIVAVVIVAGSSRIAAALIDYEWWSELHQASTWWSLLLYDTVPHLAAAAALFAAYTAAFFIGLRQARAFTGIGMLPRPAIVKLALLGLAILAYLSAGANVDNWTVVRYAGGLHISPSASEYTDPIFAKPLHFYFFDLPFYNMLVGLVLTAVAFSLLCYWLAAHLDRVNTYLNGGLPVNARFEIEPSSFREIFHSGFARLVVGVLLVALAAKLYLGRYAFLNEDHGQYLVGVDWVADHVSLPLQWLLIAACLTGALFVALRKMNWAFALLLLLPVRWFLPSLVAGLYVRPNELALETPYIRHHIEATRSAYGLNARVTEKTLETGADGPIDYAKHRAVLDNVRLWDWRAFHDTITQVQPLRPYIYKDTDVDRYSIDGQLRQVLIAPRELEIDQIGAASSRWINTHLIYTHGYGVVMAEANRITGDGLPVLLIKDAPPELSSKSLKMAEPEIYFSEVAHEPVFVDTAQAEFNYPSGSENIQTTYRGSGGFLLSPLTRLAAAVHYGDGNILLTEYLNGKSRMMIHRSIQDRLETLAGFISWDSDPYMVVTPAGNLVWMADGYLSSNAHPYSRSVSYANDDLNYIRNSVKATIDAYSGETTLYVFAPDDVLVAAYTRLFPNLFKPASAMPAALRAHARYPEMLFRAQAEIYRTFHMRDPEAFYNKADAWDFAKTAQRSSDGGAASVVSPTYVVAALPGADTPEFLLLTTFTPANKANLIGVMYARCDGEHLGEIFFEKLAKQTIVYGPMQIDARVNQDQTISKDLSLWDQRGSQVLRGQTLVLPLDNTFLYVSPIYIQASQASMPQLKKVALAMGNKLAYADTYEQALTQLIDQVGGGKPVTAAPTPATGTTTEAAPMVSPTPSADAIEALKQIRTHLQRYRELSAQGKLAEAGKELDEIQKTAGARH